MAVKETKDQYLGYVVKSAVTQQRVPRGMVLVREVEEDCVMVREGRRGRESDGLYVVGEVAVRRVM